MTPKIEHNKVNIEVHENMTPPNGTCSTKISIVQPCSSKNHHGPSLHLLRQRHQ